ncbi:MULTISPECIES: Ni/Fe-hydrogenase, b-type cytochrome subunit [Bacillus]|uniref:Ni/Fe-hydrogenase, b-type cytochrome subunit n=1 Tax=Bacillus TaxID=1386 RepID=UPI0002FCDF15|nr:MULTISPECIES: Ni/Fe-hydrogenase, b-type cytochrome subunit [Bacillus]
MSNQHANHHESLETNYKTNRVTKVQEINEKSVKIYVWQLPIRIFHWLNAGAIVLLMLTGIYIGNPMFGAIIPGDATPSYLMGWARYIHFFAAFVFTANLLFRWYWFYKGNKYSASSIFRKIFWKELWETIKFYVFMKNKKPHYVGHNPLAQLAYWIMIGGGSIIMVLTGYFLYFEPQPESFMGGMFMWLTYIFGDSFTIRSWHHIVAWLFMVFMVAHIYLSWREDYLQRNGTMSSIITGYKTEPKDTVGNHSQPKAKKKKK